MIYNKITHYSRVDFYFFFQRTHLLVIQHRRLNEFFSENSFIFYQIKITRFGLNCKVHENIIIGDLTETHRKPMEDKHVWSKTGRVSNQTCRSPKRHFDSPMRHVGLQLVSGEACWSPIWRIGLRSDMLISDQTCRSPMGFRWVSDNKNILVNMCHYYNIIMHNESCRSNYYLFGDHLG